MKRDSDPAVATVAGIIMVGIVIAQSSGVFDLTSLHAAEIGSGTQGEKFQEKSTTMGNNTPVNEPPMQTSDEGDRKGLQLAREQGEAFQRTVEHMMKDIADGGAMKRAGEYAVGYAVEKAEGMYVLRDGELQWHAPDEENIHVEIVVCDGADHRFIPGLTVHATLIDSQGKEVGTHEQPFLWHPYLYHYGRNWIIPGNGEYTLRVHIDAPPFHRHDKVNGKRFAAPVDVEFAGVRLKTGKE